MGASRAWGSEPSFNQLPLGTESRGGCETVRMAALNPVSSESPLQSSRPSTMSRAHGGFTSSRGARPLRRSPQRSRRHLRFAG